MKFQGRVLRQVACTFAILVSLAGCSTEPRSDYSSLGLVNAGGDVILDGSPVQGAVVVFEDLSDNTISYALTDPKGHYVLQFDSDMVGVKPGRKRVEVSTTRRILGLNSTDEGGDQSGTAKSNEQIPKCYNKESRLTVEVTSKSSVFNFDLKSDCSTTQPTP